MLSLMAFPKEDDMGGGEKNLGGGGDDAYAYGGSGDVAPDKLWRAPMRESPSPCCCLGWKASGGKGEVNSCCIALLCCCCC